MKRARVIARARWQALADAEFDDDTLLWVANVASALLRADATDTGDNERRALILKATGLVGAVDAEGDIIRDAVRRADFYCDLIERGSRWRPARPLERGERSNIRREETAKALGKGSRDGHGVDAALDKKIARALGK